MKMLRDKNGRFIKTSNLAEKVLGVRPYRSDREKLEEVAKLKGIEPGVLAREILKEWAKSKEVG